MKNAKNTQVRHIVATLWLSMIVIFFSISIGYSKPNQKESVSPKRKTVSREDVRRARAEIFRLFGHCGFFNAHSTTLKARRVYLLIEETQGSNLKCFESALSIADIHYKKIGSSRKQKYLIPVDYFKQRKE